MWPAVVRAVPAVAVAAPWSVAAKTAALGGGDAPPSTARLASSWGTGRGPARGKLPLPLLLTELLRVVGTASDGVLTVTRCHTSGPVGRTTPQGSQLPHAQPGPHWLALGASCRQQTAATASRVERETPGAHRPCASLLAATRRASGKARRRGLGSPRARDTDARAKRGAKNGPGEGRCRDGVIR